MTSERDRQAILARRRFFVASALAGLAATQCDKPPQPCLNVSAPEHPDAAQQSAPTESAPQPCLEVVPEPTAKDASPAVPVPAPTPSAAEQPKPAPQPCLKIALPRDLEKKR